MDALQTTIHDAYRTFTEFSDQTVFPMIPENDYISSDRCRFILGISMVSFFDNSLLSFSFISFKHTTQTPGTLPYFLVTDNHICACCTDDSILTKIQT